MAYWTPFKSEAEAQAAFWAAVASAPEGIRPEVEVNSLSNSFSVEVLNEYEDDLHRWTVAVNTALMYIDQGVGEF